MNEEQIENWYEEEKEQLTSQLMDSPKNDEKAEAEYKKRMEKIHKQYEQKIEKLMNKKKNKINNRGLLQRLFSK